MKTQKQQILYWLNHNGKLLPFPNQKSLGIALDLKESAIKQHISREGKLQECIRRGYFMVKGTTIYVKPVVYP